MIRGCDISEHQGVVDFDALKSATSFVIMRSSYGNGYTDRQFKRNQAEARRLGMLLGYYHYSYPNHNDPEAEADWFVSVVGPLRQGEQLCLDFEENYADPVTWSKKFLDRVYSKTGTRPLIYMNLSLAQAKNWSPVIQGNYGLWLAQWDNKLDSVGQTAWGTVAMKQYSDATKLAGVKGNVDGNVFYGESATFKAYGYKGTTTPTPPAPVPSGKVDAFFAKYNNKPIDFDNYYGFQCMDLAEQYNREVVGAPRIGGNAIDVWDRYPASHYTKVANTPSNFPEKGDIIIWGSAVGKYGHIAVCASANVNSFISFDQNWPAQLDANGKGLGVSHMQSHNYNGVLGWLKPKVALAPPATPPAPVPPVPAPSTDQDRQRGYQLLEEYRSRRVAGAASSFEGYVREIIGKDENYSKLQNIIQQQTQAIEELTKTLQTSDNALKELKTSQPNDQLHNQIKGILYGPGFLIQKYWKIEDLIPND